MKLSRPKRLPASKISRGLFHSHARRLLGVALVPAAIAVGYAWHGTIEPDYAAHARISIPESLAGELSKLPVEDACLSTEIINVTCDLARERGINLPLASPLDSEIEWLLDHLHAVRDDAAAGMLVQFGCTTADSELSVQILTAAVDAALRSLTPARPPATDEAAASCNAELQQLAQAAARQREKIAALEAAAAPPANGAPAQAAPTDAELESLKSALAQAAREHVDAGSRLTAVRAGLAAGTTAEQIVAGFPHDAAANGLRDLLHHAQLVRDLHSQEAALQAAAAVYGRRHPRMVELNGRIGRLREQLAAVPADQLAAAPAQASPAELLTQALEHRATQASAAEAELQQRQAAALAVREERQRHDAELTAARSELTFLEGEQNRLHLEAADARRNEAAQTPSIVEPPTLAVEPVGPPLWRTLAIAAAVGAGLAAWLRRTSPSADVRGAAAAKASAEPRPAAARFRSHDEERLLKLRAQHA